MSIISASTTSTTAYKVTADTTGTLVLQTGSTPTTAVTVGTDQSVTLAGTLAVQSQNISPYTGFKNRIINGAMVIDQRNAGAAVNNGNTVSVYTLDRWSCFGFQASKFSVQQSTDAPAGFTNSLKVTSSSAYSVPTGETYIVSQSIEGYNVSDFGLGAAGATTFTLTFWVKSSLTGTFGASFYNINNDRTYTFSYTINSANTWEQKTITITGDVTGTWNKTNSNGLGVRFGLGSGSGFSNTAGSWASGNYVQPPSTVSVVGTNGATLYITGVQLEKGSTATSFDYRPYGTELALCQRYYAKILSSSAGYNLLAPGTAASTSSVGSLVVFPVTMRAGPTFSYANIILADGAVSSVVNSIGTVYAGNNTANVTFNGATANLTLYRPTPVVANNTSAAYIDMTAEL